MQPFSFEEGFLFKSKAGKIYWSEFNRTFQGYSGAEKIKIL